MSEATKIEAWIETCSQDMNSNKTHGCDKDGFLFDILDNKLCALISEAHRQACHARLLESAAIERKAG